MLLTYTLKLSLRKNCAINVKLAIGGRTGGARILSLPFLAKVPDSLLPRGQQNGIVSARQIPQNTIKKPFQILSPGNTPLGPSRLRLALHPNQTNRRLWNWHFKWRYINKTARSETLHLNNNLNHHYKIWYFLPLLQNVVQQIQSKYSNPRVTFSHLQQLTDRIEDNVIL